MTDMNEETGEMELRSMQLECTEENYIYSFHPIASSGAVCISRNESGECIYQYYNIIKNEIEQTLPLFCELDGVLYPIKDIYDSISTFARVVLSDNTFCNALLSFADDNTSLYAYNPADNTSGNSKTVQIPLPEGYKLENIDFITCDDDIIIEFNDGSFYFGDVSEIYSTENGGIYTLEKIEELDGMADHIVSIFCDVFDVIALMDDGYIYEIR